MLSDRCHRLTDEIAKYYFNTSRANSLVFLEWTNDWINLHSELAPEILLSGSSDNPKEAGFEKFMGECLSRTEFFKNLQNEIWLWNSTDVTSAPPSLCLCLALSLAAEKMQADDLMAQNNFYSRFGLLFNLSDTSEKRFKKWYQEHSGLLWTSLEEWLNVRNNGALGLSVSGLQTSPLRHVGPALNQVLVRQADRPLIRQFFVDAKFRPRQLIPEEELQRRLDGFFRKEANRHKPLAKKWNNQSSKNSPIRTLISDICRELLQDWDGSNLSKDVENTNQPIQLYLLLDKKDDSLAEVGVVVPSPSTSSTVTLDFLEKPLQELPNLFEATQLAYRSYWASIEDLSSNFDSTVNLFLNQKLKFADAQNSITYRRNPRRVAVFTRMPQYPSYFLEVPTNHRVDANEEIVLLVHDSMKEAVTEYLALVADAGFEVRAAKLKDTDLKTWSIFRQVRIVRQTPESIKMVGERSNSELQNLAPNRTSSIQFIGGFKLPGRASRYLSDALPKIIFFYAEAGAISCTVFHEGELKFEREFSGSYSEIDLRVLGNLVGLLEIQFQAQDSSSRPLANSTTRIEAVSEFARGENWSQFRIVHEAPNAELSIRELSAAAGTGVSGLAAPGAPLRTKEKFDDVQRFDDWITNFQVQTELAALEQVNNTNFAFADHKHVYKLPPEGRTRIEKQLPPIRAGEIFPLACEDPDCDRIFYHQPIAPAKKKGRSRNLSDEALIEFDFSGSKQVDGVETTLKHLLAAISFLGCGNLLNLFSMAGQLENVERREVIRLLESAGLVEIKYDASKSGMWSVCTPAFVRNQSGSWSIVGCFAEKASEFLSENSVPYLARPPQSQLDLADDVLQSVNLLAKDLTPEDTVSILEKLDALTEIRPDQIFIIGDPASNLINFFEESFHASLNLSLRQIPSIGGDFEFCPWNLKTWRFESESPLLNHPGMYRIRKFGGYQEFVCITPESLSKNLMYKGSSSLMKLFWLLHCKQRVAAFEDNQLILPGGMYLPLLLSRAVFARHQSLGRQGHFKTRDVTIYSGIKEGTADEILSSLYRLGGDL